MDLHSVLNEIVEVMQQTHTTHTITMRSSVPATIVGDRGRLAQVFLNLISNAIKYSPQADTVDITIVPSSETVFVRIRDYGIGIAHEQQQHIFERFFRVAEPVQQSFPGLGVGLYIVAEIVRQHQGRVTVQSVPGKGSVFEVMLPYTQDFSSVRGGEKEDSIQ